jgi:hypothetical protein
LAQAHSPFCSLKTIGLLGCFDLFHRLFANKLLDFWRQGDVVITIFGNFYQFTAEKLGDFLEKQLRSFFLHKLLHFESKSPNFSPVFVTFLL